MVRSMLTHLGDTAPGRAFRRLLATVSARPILRHGSSSGMVECSIGFLAEGAEVGRGTACSAIAALRQTMPVTVTIASAAAAAGWVLRTLAPGKRRGPLLTLPIEGIEAARAIVAELDAADRAGLDRAWHRLDPADLAARGAVQLVDVQALRTRCRCPLHNDADPSMVRLPGKAPERGGARCHAGCGSLGWATATDGTIWVWRAASLSSPGDLGGVQETSGDLGGSVAAQLTHVSHPGSSLVSYPPPTPVFAAVVSARPPAVVLGQSATGVVGEAACGFVLGAHSAHVAGDLRERYGRTFLARRWSRDPIDALAWNARNGAKSERRALEAAALVAQGKAPVGIALPDRYLSVGRLKAIAVSLHALPGQTPRPGEDILMRVVPTQYANTSQSCILIDLDDLQSCEQWNREEWAARVATIAVTMPGLSGRCAMVETSDTGLQAWLFLDADVMNPAEWFARADVRAWYAAIADACLRAAHDCGRSGGHVDMCACAAGRNGRLTGWRICDGMRPFLVRALGFVTEPGGAVRSAREVNALRISAKSQRDRLAR